MLKTLFRLASPAGPGSRLSVLIFHRVLATVDPLFPGELDVHRFDAVCGWVRAWFNVLPLDQAVMRLRDGTLPERALSITFDDGYADNHDIALPVLRRHGLTATFFVATGFLDGGRMWNDTLVEAVRRTRLERLPLDELGVEGLVGLPVMTLAERRQAIAILLRAIKYLEPARRVEVVEAAARQAGATLPDDLMMRSAQLIGLHRAGMQIGAHTVSHPILARLDAEAARREITDGRRTLESLIDEPVLLFAYPNGKPGEDYASAHVEMARDCGFDAALSTSPGAAGRAADLFQLPRFTPWDRTRLRFGGRMLANLKTAA